MDCTGSGRCSFTELGSARPGPRLRTGPSTSRRSLRGTASGAAPLPACERGGVPRSFASDRDWTFDRPVDELWDRLSSPQRYAEWWPWLRRFDPGDGFVEGAEWSCEVQPPLPYVVRFRIRLDRVDPGRRASASVRGDIRGHAELTVDRVGAATSRARLRSGLAPAHPLLAGFGRVARPLVEWGHDWVLDQGRRQFVDRAL